MKVMLFIGKLVILSQRINGGYWDIKIIDFGYAIENKVGDLVKPECGSPNYMPPEIVKRVHYDPMFADVWSVGVIIYKMML